MLSSCTCMQQMRLSQTASMHSTLYSDHKCILDSGFGFKKLFIYCYYFYNILGFVCNRKDLSASGCCHSGGESTRRYECTDCQSNNCCSIYEHCVSCCLSPDNVSSKKWFDTEYIHAFSSRSKPSINSLVYLFMYIVLVTLKWLHGSSQAFQYCYYCHELLT